MKTNNDNKVLISLRILRPLWKEVCKLANQKHLTKTQIVERALSSYIYWEKHARMDKTSR